MQFLPKWSKPRYLKAVAPHVPQIVWTVLVWCLLSGIRILIYSFTGWFTSKIYLWLEDNRSSFSHVSLKSETFFRKQKFDVKQLKINKFIFNVKQLKMRKFIKSIWPLINSASNATLEVPSLHPWWVWICSSWWDNSLSTPFCIELLMPCQYFSWLMIVPQEKAKMILLQNKNTKKKKNKSEVGEKQINQSSNRTKYMLRNYVYIYIYI